MCTLKQLLQNVAQCADAFEFLIGRLRHHGFPEQAIVIACLQQAYTLFTDMYGRGEEAQAKFREIMADVFAQDPRPPETLH